MKAKTLIPVAALLAATTLLTACQEQNNASSSNESAPAQAAMPADTVAIVNGHPISQARLQAVVRENTRPGADPDQVKEQVLNSLINIEILVSEAERLAMDKREDVVAKLAEQRRNTLSTALIQEQLSTFSVTDDQLKAEYDKQFATPEKEYKARHILVKDENAARDIIAELDKGADFAELAKAKSTGPSGSNGGDLGWFTAARMVKPFSDAVAAMQVGKYSRTPVKTQFGWHVILLEDSRDVPAPAFDEVSKQLKTMLQRRHIQNYLEQLREKADIRKL